MADGSNNKTSTGSITEEQRQSLSIHRNTMDIETAGSLHKIRGVVQLMLGAIEGADDDAKLPEGLHEGLWVLSELATTALKRAGAV